MSTITIDGLFKAPYDKAGLLYHDKDIINRHWPIKAGDVCFDIGFGPGSWTLYALAKGGITYSFDPKPYAVGLLEEFTKLNGFTNGHIHQAGLMDRIWVLPFGNSSFKCDPKQVECNCYATTMDAFCSGESTLSTAKIERLDYVNIDVESAELEVIRGGRETIRKFAPHIVIEIHAGVSETDLRRELSILHPYQFTLEPGNFLIARPKK